MGEAEEDSFFVMESAGRTKAATANTHPSGFLEDGDGSCQHVSFHLLRCIYIYPD